MVSIIEISLCGIHSVKTGGELYSKYLNMESMIHNPFGGLTKCRHVHSECTGIQQEWIAFTTEQEAACSIEVESEEMETFKIKSLVTIYVITENHEHIHTVVVLDSAQPQLNVVM